MSDTIYCNQCGAKNAKNSKFCSQCGQPITIIEEDASRSPAAPSTTSPPPAPRHTEATCPVCNSSNQVTKVSAIVAAQTASGSTYGYDYATERGYSSHTRRTTILAETLKQPSPPLHATALGELGEGLGKVFLVFVGLFSFFLGYLAMVTPSTDTPDKYFCLFFALLLGGGSIWAAIEKKETTPEQAQEVAAWQVAVNRWNKSYYCARCDKVFLSEGGKQWYVDSSHFYDLLYATYKK